MTEMKKEGKLYAVSAVAEMHFVVFIPAEEKRGHNSVVYDFLGDAQIDEDPEFNIGQVHSVSSQEALPPGWDEGTLVYHSGIRDLSVKDALMLAPKLPTQKELERAGQQRLII